MPWFLSRDNNVVILNLWINGLGPGQSVARTQISELITTPGERERGVHRESHHWNIGSELDNLPFMHNGIIINWARIKSEHFIPPPGAWARAQLNDYFWSDWTWIETFTALWNCKAAWLALWKLLRPVDVWCDWESAMWCYERESATQRDQAAVITPIIYTSR